APTTRCCVPRRPRTPTWCACAGPTSPRGCRRTRPTAASAHSCAGRTAEHRKEVEPVGDNMQRGSDHLNVHRDDEAKREMQGWLRSGHPTRAEEWDDAEPGADDDPEVTERPVPAPGAADPAEAEAE